MKLIQKLMFINQMGLRQKPLRLKESVDLQYFKNRIVLLKFYLYDLMRRSPKNDNFTTRLVSSNDMDHQTYELE